MKQLGEWMLWLAVVAGLALLIEPAYLDSNDKRFILLIGAIGLWRYGNGAIHLLRACYFMQVAFPRWRRTLSRNPEAYLPGHVYLVVTSFRIPAATTWTVYASVFREAIQCGVPATVVVSIVERGDERLIRQCWQTFDPQQRLRLIICRARGTGKRDGLAMAFRAVSRTMPDRNAVVGVIDGDTMLAPNCVRDSVGFFALMPRLGGLTTNEQCVVHGSRAMRDWHTMRFAQRHLNMCSMALSRRVLTMTGRMSFFRAAVLTSPAFIADVESDYLQHWRLGRFRFLTGDDKSSWNSLMSMGWDTFYVPDAHTLTVEHPPHPRFVPATLQLMFRWYGNSLRQNLRATRLGWRRLGLFASYVLYDQRISMWTCLIGLGAALGLGLLQNIQLLLVYLFWIALSRTLVTILLTLTYHPVGPLYPVLLYYNQIVGSLVKIYALFHLDRQSWTRQKTRLAARSGGFDVALARVSSKTMLVSALALFTGGIYLLTTA
ncbi:alginate biosynthesis protein Alg8 [Alcanivorax hongdengensis A-11-3]|uniref:Alginate biosynthesis protein Alg8 n=1 Tax=Alcanivorax hongdengensis A-11-3 TaxID=1177179 RepID=L0WF36_9GAMM|nr:glycosyltransferase family 2 protein [Alcanivorax hongdengensis]EKF74400.1 alginate biosynthesis protein Alg8 [Alcanivorax hongdengensis A-11-3]